MNRTNLWIIIEIAEELKRLKTSKKYFSKKTDFTRDRVFTFETVFHLIADLPRLSLSIEIEKGLKEINKIIGKREEGTKGGFCKARNKILVFIWFFSKTSEYNFYKKKKFQNFREH